MSDSRFNTILLAVLLMLAIANYWTIRDMYSARGGVAASGKVDFPAPMDAPAKSITKVTREGLGSRVGNPAPVLSTFTANVSAYCPCELCTAPYADGITASGHVIQPGDKFVAAPPEYPFGTMLDIPGYGQAVPVLDRGGAIKGNKLDVFFPNHEAALEWGRKILTVSIIGG